MNAANLKLLFSQQQPKLRRFPNWVAYAPLLFAISASPSTAVEDPLTNGRASSPSNSTLFASSHPTHQADPERKVPVAANAARTAASREANGSAQKLQPSIDNFNTIRTSNTELRIGYSCNQSAPCSFRFGSTAYKVVQGATATLRSGTGEAFIYLSPAGRLNIGGPMKIECTGCTASSDVTSFPADSIPLYSWKASQGRWEVNGGIDWRATLSGMIVQAGVGLVNTNVAGATTLSLDTSVVGIRVAVPAHSQIGCTQGAWSMDEHFLYVCTAPNRWRRSKFDNW